LTALQKFCREAIAGVQVNRGHPFIVTEDTETHSSAAHDLFIRTGASPRICPYPMLIAASLKGSPC
jgi:hypothetical protein